MAKDNYGFPDRIGRLELVKIVPPNEGEHINYQVPRGIYVEEPNYKVLDVAEARRLHRTPNCGCDKAAGRCITDREDFWVPQPWTYYVFNNTPNRAVEAMLACGRLVWSLLPPDQLDQTMVWVPLLNMGHNSSLCSPAHKTYKKGTKPSEKLFNEVYELVWGSLWNCDYGYYPSAFTHWLLNKQMTYHDAGGPDVNDYMMQLFSAWQKIDIDELMRAPHSSLGFNLKQFLENPYVGPTMPNNSPYLYVDKDGVLQSTRDQAKLPRKLRWK